ncbi:MAG: hypothetical protein KY468_06580 [Armatimonadetes bacterium]|nr:hypothetical protein [Armatimonadota bacterium]
MKSKNRYDISDYYDYEREGDFYLENLISEYNAEQQELDSIIYPQKKLRKASDTYMKRKLNR